MKKPDKRKTLERVRDWCDGDEEREGRGDGGGRGEG